MKATHACFSASYISLLSITGTFCLRALDVSSEMLGKKINNNNNNKVWHSLWTESKNTLLAPENVLNFPCGPKAQTLSSVNVAADRGGLLLFRQVPPIIGLDSCHPPCYTF